MGIKANTKLIRDVLSRKNWSERKLAYRTGLSQATVSRVLSGKRGAGVKTMKAFHKVFPDVPLDTLFLIEQNVTERD